jgi:hypothetical protein
VFVEGEYTKFWDSKIYNSSIGFNFRLWDKSQKS